MKNKIYKMWNWFLFVLTLFTIVMMVQCVFERCAQAIYIPSLSTNQLTVSTMGELGKMRYKEDFEYSVSFLQMQITKNIRMTSVFEIADDHGEAGFFTLFPLIKDRLYAIAGGSYSTKLTMHGGGGLQLMLGKSAFFIKQLGEDSRRGGFLIPLGDGLFHAGASGTHTVMENEKNIWRLGIMFGINFGALSKEEQKNWKKILPNINKEKQDERTKNHDKENEAGPLLDFESPKWETIATGGEPFVSKYSATRAAMSMVKTVKKASYGIEVVYC